MVLGKCPFCERSQFGAYISQAGPMMPQPAVSPIASIFRLVRLDRILIDILECLQIFPAAGYDPRKEAATPYVPDEAVNPIERHREHAHDPLHQSREIRMPTRLNHEVEMVAHYAEIVESEVESLPCSA